MSVETLQTLSYASYILAGVLFLLTIILFFLLRVPKLFGDVTGRTARREIESLQKKNEGSEVKTTRTSNRDQVGFVDTARLDTGELFKKFPMTMDLSQMEVSNEGFSIEFEIGYSGSSELIE